MAAISSKAYGTFFVKVFQMHDATMGSFVAAVSMKGIFMSVVEQNFEDNAIGLRRSSTATLKPKERAGPPHPSLLMPEKEPQAHMPGARSGRLGQLRFQFSRLPPQRWHWDPMQNHKRAVSTC